MPPKDDDDPASTKEVVTKKQKQLLNREELDLNLIAESLGCYIIERPFQSLTTDDPEGLGKRIKKSAPKVDAGPSSHDFDPLGPEDVGLEDDPSAKRDFDADSESDMRSGRSDPKTGGPKPQAPPGTSSNMGARIRAALRDFRKRLTSKLTSPKGQPRSVGGNQVLGAIATTAGLSHILQNLQTFDPKYKATEDPTSPLYQPPQPEVERLKPTERKKPVEPKPVETKPAETETAGDPEQTPDKKSPVVKPKNPDGDKKNPPVVVNPPVNVGPGNDNKTGSKQGVTPLTQDQLAQVARTAATVQTMKAATSKTGKGKFKFGVPQQARGKIGRRQNPQ